MNKRFLALAMFAASGVGHAEASTFQFDFAGTVTAESISLFSGPAPDFSAVIGRSFTSQFSFDDTSGTLIGQGSVTLDLSGHPGDFIAPAEVAGEKIGTYTTDLGPSLTKLANGSYTGSVTSIIGPTFTFNYDPSATTATIAADFAASAIDRADDQGDINLTLTATRATSNVSPVPLPASLPMFGAALLSLGVIAWSRRAYR